VPSPVGLAAVAVGLLVVLAGAIGLLFAGSPTHIAAGVRVAGVNVGGLSARDARVLLQRRAAALLRVPVTFTAGGRSFRVTPDSLGVAVNWPAAVAEARRQGEGLGPLRGFKRLDVRFFGADVTPQPRVFQGALDLEVARIARVVDRPHREPALRLHGLRPVLVPGSEGRVLDRGLASTIIVRSLASFERGRPVALPVRVDPPTLTAAALAPAAAQTRRALAAPVRLTLGPTRFKLPRWRVAQLLELPAGGRRTLRIGGPEADAWLGRLAKKVSRPPVDAGFAVDGSHVRVVPAQPGLTLDARATARVLLRAALRPLNRVAPIAVAETPAKRSTKAAQAMGVTGLVSSYTTYFGGVPNRIHNVQLVARLVDGKLIGPGETFSFNGTTGERSAAKGFLEAPVIVNGELQTGLGGGVCQVSTTVFNAAYDAGLKITERTNHALYISHYPQGRDATVNYPDVDLKFVNDTDHWLLLRTFVGSSQLTVSLYGAPQHRKVESIVAPLVETGPPPVKKTVDPSLKPGEVEVDDYGSPSRSTSVRRKVYDASGKLLYDDVWYSSYRSEPKLVRVGPKKKKEKPGATTSTGATTTTPTPTTSTPAETTALPSQ
jgi:vancomycin resistance protein YoaR